MSCFRIHRKLIHLFLMAILIQISEVRRRKWLEKYPESTTNEEPVVFDTSIIPWWAWIKRFHLPETELLNGLFMPFSSLL